MRVRPIRAPRLGATLAACAALAVVAVEAAAQSRSCALQVQPQGGRTGYQSRGRLCEGMYVGLHAAPRTVQVISLVRDGLRYDLAGPDGGLAGDSVLYVHVPRLPAGFGNDPVLLLGRTRESNVNWALDAEVGAGEVLPWDLRHVIVPEELRSARVGIAGQAEAPGPGRTLYVPVSVVDRPGPAPARADSIELVVKVPDAARAAWSLGGGAERREAERLNVDGYFRIVLPPAAAPGEASVAIYWRARGQSGWREVPELVRIYRW